MKTAKNRHPLEIKRRGHHQKRDKHFGSVYWPYIPMLAILTISFLISGVRPTRGILAYATNVSVSGLLSATNSQRNQNGQKSLSLNSKLNSAAQAKANDMTARNYWSHNTPDGQEPWVFIDHAGYLYQKAGENLAYGFTTSQDTITGWMNSPSHRENLLDSAFADVGFGFTNSSNYNNSGPETVVVAMYGKPQVLAATTTTPASSTPKAVPKSTLAPAASTQPTTATPTPASDTLVAPTAANPLTSSSSAAEPAPRAISRIELLTRGKAPWAMLAVGLFIGTVSVVWLIKHGLKLSRLLRNSERFILHHPVFDGTVVSLLILGLTLARTVGTIR